jgi:hypothetical protein
MEYVDLHDQIVTRIKKRLHDLEMDVDLYTTEIYMECYAALHLQRMTGLDILDLNTIGQMAFIYALTVQENILNQIKRRCNDIAETRHCHAASMLKDVSTCLRTHNRYGRGFEKGEFDVQNIMHHNDIAVHVLSDAYLTREVPLT